MFMGFLHPQGLKPDADAVGAAMIMPSWGGVGPRLQTKVRFKGPLRYGRFYCTTAAQTPST